MKSQTNTVYIIFLAVVAAMGGILFGYDTAVISGTVSDVAKQFSLNTMQQGWYVGCALIGSIIGVAVAGILSDGFGRKITMLISAVFFSWTAIGCAICTTFPQLVIYRMIGGFGIGIVSIVSPIYISEISVAKYRGTMVSMYQLAVTAGFVLAYIINYWILQTSAGAQFTSPFWNRLFVTETWRGMLGAEIVPALMFFLIIFLIPESPRWLIIKNRDSKALKILGKIYRTEKEAQQQLEYTKSVSSSAAGDSAQSDSKTSNRNTSGSSTKSEWKRLNTRGMRKALWIGIAIAMLGQFMGVNAVLYYGPSIFQDAGLDVTHSLFSQVLVGLVNMVTTIIAVIIIDKVGRKKLVYWGVSGMIISLLMIGFYFLFKDSMGLPNLFLLIFFLFYIFCCAISICAVVFVILSEMYPNSIRGLAMSIAGLSLWIGTYLIGQLTPWMLENLTPAGTFFLFAAMCVPYIIIMWKCVPETTGKTLEEIEQYWKSKD